MSEVDYDNIVCSLFKCKKVSFLGLFEHISADDIVKIIYNSQGYYSKSALDDTLDYIVLSNDAYARYTKKIFRPYQDIAFIYNNVNKYNIEIISENKMLEMCSIRPVDRIIPNYLGRQIFYPLSEYVVLDIICTGYDYYLDEILQISAIKIKDNAIIDDFVVNIKPLNYSNDYIVTVLRGHIKKPLIRYTLEEAIIRYANFVQNLPIVSLNVLLKNNLVFYLYYQTMLRPMNNDYVDIIQLAGNIFPSMKKVTLDNVAKKLNITLGYNQINSSSWCENIYNCYEILKKKSRFKDPSTFKFNVFKNKVFVLEGIFESISRQFISDVLLNVEAKISKTLCKSVDYLLLSNHSYCEYVNGKKSKKQVMAENLMMDGSKILIISEMTFKNILYYNSIENNEGIDAYNLLSY